MMFKSKDIGKLGENLALQYLKKARFSILEKNFHSHWGEIDIIAKKDNKVFFIEVKTRISDKKGKPYEAINFYKLRGLKRAVNYYILQNRLNGYKLSLDLISIILNEDSSVKKLDYFENIDN
ncbi:hypothetical protein A3C98_03850 [Candidatus Roizmanbacteria bacterium RIFCSPHIGHO2_02_FULL_37_15]|uniref:UPF0102 protein A3B40_03890 n=1 Tax=Candidatus Roizmanbacteria bacterium RIFCSPLOWO2_01_FULL_37_16 TaxID=1802058 RepID=A0A1F7IKQ6_9BACT|nr:MAG: hypothetical protein A2859_04885 [Candidatus Roizmanbacteria bacterium RIFCSPHIGHO2_01_FULL_37_16b]OGK22002.1 MAG: hypothetical protein A3C98_03850 [Candidatus Roizmanbacteria bacterium RIFCSPHIGHO2_02_FULL_37_15]OGK31763.1 MAG: hypothetical protein A3F57_00255 [Candidatus Roizmanbacteria bacterium RIFCSPHIGHO2_12_FULL_36_11]OGK43923.1 MAG: hypothetical protein A3B40_03890 [Candidatus Roizmanbacteria bacterium RIFCSPLOWO2_01_FULL_37_16]OGK56348.1 MAG: hypothetical protein A3I50_03435 [C